MSLQIKCRRLFAISASAKFEAKRREKENVKTRLYKQFCRKTQCNFCHAWSFKQVQNSGDIADAGTKSH